MYDNSVSPDEVRRLSQALIIHYPLSSRYIENTTNIIRSFKTDFNTYPLGSSIFDYNWSNQSGGTCVISEHPSEAGKWAKFISGGTSSNRIYFYETSLEIGTYTISMDIISTLQFNLVFALERCGGDYSCTQTFSDYTTPNKVQRLSMTVTSTSVTSYFVFVRSSNITVPIYFRNIQIEKKDHITPYTKSSRTGIVRNIVGYPLTGTLAGTSKLITIDEDTARYSCACKFDGSGFINIPFGNGLPNNNWTVSCWVKRPEEPDTYSMRLFFAASSGTNLRFYFRLLKLGSTNNMTFNVGYGVNTYGRAPITLGWHHLAVTTNDSGDSLQLYVDGEPAGSGTDHAFNFASNFYIGYNFIGCISDVKVYRTTLSAEAVKHLYKYGD